MLSISWPVCWQFTTCAFCYAFWLSVKILVYFLTQFFIAKIRLKSNTCENFGQYFYVKQELHVGASKCNFCPEQLNFSCGHMPICCQFGVPVSRKSWEYLICVLTVNDWLLPPDHANAWHGFNGGWRGLASSSSSRGRQSLGLGRQQGQCHFWAATNDN